jgi:hypothetical protein
MLCQEREKRMGKWKGGMRKENKIGISKAYEKL